MSHPPPPARRSDEPPAARGRLFGRGTWHEAELVRDLLRTETVGGAVLLLAAVAALAFANSPWRAAYATLRDTRLGPSALHLDLSLGAWASDGLLAVFFLVAGVELKREFTAGDLADPRKAALPIAAAVAGVATPAILYAAVVTVSVAGGDALRGWAIPTATDIAFALAVLAVIGTHLPSALRAFLLTLAVVDDLIAITIIALFYTSSVNMLALAGATVPLLAWHVLLRRRVFNPVVLAVPALLTWVLVHASGVHATVAGVLLGLTVPVSRAVEDDPDRRSIAERLEHRLRPFSAGVAVPVFAFFAAGVTVVGGGLAESLTDRAAVAVMVGLVVGKAVGVLGGTWAVAKFTRAQLDEDLAWSDVLGLSLLAGVGFTVSLLIGELAFGSGSPRDDHVKVAVLLGSLCSALLAAVVLRLRERHYRSVHVRESADRDADGVPDVYEAQ
ncbi:MAG TPA: Na+/H+ antiporter NhaA [Intrasporangium sp.]|uniref:Na+/H+ antiporter NhaA n=1 Tax=Intrasporangium sp. TaxID=1925024 RepID=UPI002D768931|nr:Na+/H+ antiporter NhaA [Intrasporangium sp.]HET7398026.1 Na+/H+ antiporter NhaA [Intrasporangium sp.]